MTTPTDAERERRVTAERERLWRAHRADFEDGAKRARERNALYPPGFHGWPLERRNAWFAGFNVGYLDRKRAEGCDG